MNELLTPFHYDYMLRAMAVSALVGGTCGFLSSFVTLKGWSLMGDALSHAVVPGVALAYILGLPFALGAFVAGLLAADTMGFIKAKSRIREDATIGIVFTSYFALGLLLISLNPAEVDLNTIILGNILGISDPDIAQVIVISAVTLIVLGLKWKDLKPAPSGCGPAGSMSPCSPCSPPLRSRPCKRSVPALSWRCWSRPAPPPIF